MLADSGLKTIRLFQLFFKKLHIFHTTRYTVPQMVMPLAVLFFELVSCFPLFLFWILVYSHSLKVLTSEPILHLFFRDDEKKFCILWYSLSLCEFTCADSISPLFQLWYHKNSSTLSREHAKEIQ